MQVDHSGPQRESLVLLAFPKILCQDLIPLKNQDFEKL